MKKHAIVLSFIIISVLTVVSLLILTQQFKIDSIKSSGLNYKVKETTSGTWAEYEYQRLRNPQTGKIPPNINKRQEEFANTLPDVKSLHRKNGINKTSNSEYSWKNRGPYNVGGRTRALAIDIRNENIILAGGVSGGMWKSSDNGISWSKTTNSYQLHNISCVVQDTRPGHENTWYYGTGEYSGGHDEARAFVPYRGDGIFKSSDNGDSWQLLESTSSNKPEAMDKNLNWIWRIAVDPSNMIEEEVYAAAYGAIYRSIDGGDSWNIVLGGMGLARSYTDVAVTSEGVVYAALCFGSSQGLYRSDDGINWTEITPAGWPSFFNRVLISVAPSNENSVYFFTETTATWAQSINNGTYAFWKYKYLSGNGTGAGCEWDNRSSSMFHNYAGVGFCMFLSVYPENEDIVILGRQSMHRSRDGFKTSSYIDLIGDAAGTFFEEYGLHCDHHAMVFSPTNPKIAYAASDGGVAKTIDITATNVQWTSLEYGYITSQFYTVAIPNIEGDPRIMGGMHDNGSYMTSSFNKKEHWNYLMWGDGAFAAFADGGSKMIVSWQSGNSYIGNRIPPTPSHWVWTRMNPLINTALFINPIAVDPNNDKIVYMAGGYQLLRCDDITAIPLDGSDSQKNGYWNSIAGNNTSLVTSIGISQQPANIVYFGTNYGQIYKLENASSNSPIKSVISNYIKLPRRAYVSNIAVDPHNADHIVVTYANYEVRSIFASYTGGSTWIDISGNLEENPSGSGSGPAVNWAAILPEEEGNTYFVGTSVGLFSTRHLDGFNTIWAQEGPEIIGNVNVKMVAARESDGEVAVATYGNGIYSRDFTLSSISGDESKIPNNFILYQNYPNPFNPTTTINFHIPNTRNVEIVVYNLLGTKIKTLVNQKFNAGTHEITWDSTNEHGIKVSSGIYIYKMQAGDFFGTKKMVLLK